MRLKGKLPLFCSPAAFCPKLWLAQHAQQPSGEQEHTYIATNKDTTDHSSSMLDQRYIVPIQTLRESKSSTTSTTSLTSVLHADEADATTA
eukprot:4667717-Amphidinium_carterae.1